nr:MAG TPA: hypothetical protein [Caudoviricetes sp.]
MIKYMKYILIHADTFEHLTQKLTNQLALRPM